MNLEGLRRLPLAAALLLAAAPAVPSAPFAAAVSAQAPTAADTASRLPPPVASFLAGGLGRAAPEAPPENRFFGQLVGVWRCALRLEDGSRAFPSTWAFKHGLGGFAVEHLYFQAKKDLVPPLRALGRDLLSQAMTLYDPAAGGWRFVGSSNIAGAGLGGATQAMTGSLRSGALVFQRDSANREIFANVGPRSFEWRREELPRGGGRWEVSVVIECRRP